MKKFSFSFVGTIEADGIFEVFEAVAEHFTGLADGDDPNRFLTLEASCKPIEETSE